MSGSPKEKLQTETAATEVQDEREVYLRDGRKLVVTEVSGHELVEIRSESGMVEVRIEMTERGPILRMESVKLELKAEESIVLESAKVAIKAGAVKIESDEHVEVDANGEVRVTGKMIHLN